MPAVLLDEDTPGDLAKAFHRRSRLSEQPPLDVIRVGEPGAPPFGTQDRELLIWCEENDRILVSNDRNTMPGHLAAHLSSGRHSPGVLLLKHGYTIPQAVESVMLIVVLEPELCRDRFAFIPL